MEYFCRISLPYDDVKQALAQVAEQTTHLIVYQHDEDEDVNRTHIHFYVVWKSSTDTLKNRFKPFIPQGSKGNSLWEFKTEYKDYDTKQLRKVTPNCITYMSKGELDPSFVKGFTQEQIDEYKSKWVNRPKNGSYQTKLQYICKESAGEAKKRKNDYISEMIAELGNHQPPNLEYYADEVIVRVIIKVLNDNNVVFSRYTIRDYYDTVCSRNYTEKFINSMIKFLTPKT